MRFFHGVFGKTPGSFGNWGFFLFSRATLSDSGLPARRIDRSHMLTRPSQRAEIGEPVRSSKQHAQALEVLEERQLLFGLWNEVVRIEVV